MKKDLKESARNLSSNVCNNSTRAVSGLTSGISPIILALMPKCGACIIAYSGTMAMCGNGMATESFQRSGATSSILMAVFISLVTLFAILVNSRGIRTVIAASLVILGSGLSLISMLKTGGPILYYSGSVVMFIGVWTNTSMLSVIRQLFGKTKTSCIIN